MERVTTSVASRFGAMTRSSSLITYYLMSIQNLVLAKMRAFHPTSSVETRWKIQKLLMTFIATPVEVGITVEYNVETPLGDLTYLGGYNEGFADSERADYTQNAIYSVGDTPAAPRLILSATTSP